MLMAKKLNNTKEKEMTSEAMVMGYALLEKITQMEETIKEQSEEITALLKAIKEYERGE
jgi:cell division protein FtsL